MLMMKARERQRLGLDFLSVTKELVEVSEQICQAQLDASSAPTGPKKGSKKRWRRRSGRYFAVLDWLDRIQTEYILSN